MENIRQYLLSVVACATICAVVISITDKKSTLNPVIKLLAGLFMIYTVISPWAKLRIDGVKSYFSDIEINASSAVANGTASASGETGAIIKSQVEAYILDKASSIGAEISAEVIMDNSTPPLPKAIKISGTLAPYHKQRLEQIIADELGIPKESQSWT